MRIEKVKLGVKDYAIAITYIDGKQKRTVCTNSAFTSELKQNLREVTDRVRDMYNIIGLTALTSVTFASDAPRVTLAISIGVYQANLSTTIKCGETPTVSEVELIAAFTALQDALSNFLKECGNN